MAPVSQIDDAVVYLLNNIERENGGRRYALMAEINNQVISLKDDLEQVSAIMTRLKDSESLNIINRGIVNIMLSQYKKLARKIDMAEKSDVEGLNIKDISREWLNLRNWFFFFLTSQDYKSPAAKRENTVFQGGLLKISKYVKYIRSEVNTPNFGDNYDRNAVLIQSSASESFTDLCAAYLALVKSKKSLKYTGDLNNLSDFMNANSDNMVVIKVSSSAHLSKIETQLLQLIEKKPQFTGTLYIRLNSTKSGDNIQNIRDILKDKIDINILIEENYDPFEKNTGNFRKVTLIDNGADPLRYQLLQDSASMGYRPTMDKVARYYYSAGKIEEILNTEFKTEDDIVSPDSAETVLSLDDKKERDRDYQVLTDTLTHLIEQLEKVTPHIHLDSELKKALYLEAESVRRKLNSVVNNDRTTVKETSRTFHESYYKVRTLLLYASRLQVITSDLKTDYFEKQISDYEGGYSLAANSGMSAARAVITELSDNVGEAFTTEHYWETDFLMENIFSHNPHYKDSSHKLENRLTKIPFSASERDIEKLVDEMLARNSDLEGGQLLAVDRSIAPFFYTRTFDLFHLCQYLDMQSYRIKNPIYLVVDNTLDFASVNQTTLFPNGMPENVYLIFTASMAKLHQLGMDMITGGVINIHFHQNNAVKAKFIYENLKNRIKKEKTAQDAYKSALIQNVFYQRYKNNTMKNYLDYMIRKRQRNTRALINSFQGNLGEYLQEDNEIRGIYHYKNPADNSRLLEITDSDGERHQVEFSFHYDPKSCIHSFFRILEDETDKYVAGPVFEEMKKRIFAKAAREGIHLADGTSWGFHITRMDWYMHTMRLATGLEHNKNLAKLGVIISSVLKELFLYPEDFLNNVEVETITPELLTNNSQTILKLDREIPHNSDNPTKLDYYLKDEPGKWQYSFVIKDQEKIAAMLLAYEKNENGEKTVYISKASTAKEFRGRGFFKRMNFYLKDLAKANGINKVTLETSASEKNENIIKAYEKCGFEVVDTITEMMDDGWPLIKVKMELPTERSDLAVIDHFIPVTAETYKQIHDQYV